MTEYERTMINAAKARLTELSVDPHAVDLEERAQAQAAMCEKSNADHALELVVESSVMAEHKLSKALAEMFRAPIDKLGPLESVLYDYICEQLRKWEEQAIRELGASDMENDESEMWDAIKHYQEHRRTA